MKEPYFEFLRFPSISADPEHASNVRRCAEWVASFLDEGGLDAELWETSGHPVVFAQNEQVTGRPTLLLYGHYDVQPVDPTDLWESDPFEPTERGGKIYARGAQDNKGQIFYTMWAVREYLKKDPKLNIKLCIEGEEESGSTGLAGILKERKEQLKADALLVVDVEIPGPGVPAITLGARGMVAVTIECTGSNRDLHSGFHGGITYNPNHTLVELLAKLRDQEGKIQLPGFYDDVEELSEEEKQELDLSFDEAKYRAEFGSEPVGGELAYSPAESGTTRPTLEINGLSGGYGGPGFKTVIPAKATAKLSCRLVPSQDPEKIASSICSFLEERAPKGMKLSFSFHGKEPAARSSATSKIAKAAARAYTDLFGTPCRKILAGGSIPVASHLANASGGDLLFVGLGLPTDCIHSPNEHFDLERLELGVQLIESILKNFEED